MSIFKKSKIIINQFYFNFQKKDKDLDIFFKVKCYRIDLISENLVNWYGPKNLPTNKQYKS